MHAHAETAGDHTPADQASISQVSNTAGKCCRLLEPRTERRSHHPPARVLTCRFPTQDVEDSRNVTEKRECSSPSPLPAAFAMPPFLRGLRELRGSSLPRLESGAGHLPAHGSRSHNPPAKVSARDILLTLATRPWKVRSREVHPSMGKYQKTLSRAKDLSQCSQIVPRAISMPGHAGPLVHRT
jgi:hypothetical protein